MVLVLNFIMFFRMIFTIWFYDATNFCTMPLFSLTHKVKALLFRYLNAMKTNQSLPSSYRPTPLLNINNKIIANVINSRMRCYLNEIIRPGQIAFIKERHIGDNIPLFF